MNIGGAVVIFVILWWCVFFAVLPVGIRGHAESNTEIVKGNDTGAPINPDLKRKAIWTSGIAFILWLIVCGIILSGIINFRE